MDQSRDEMSRNIGQNGPTMDRKDVNGPIRGEDLSSGIDYYFFIPIDNVSVLIYYFSVLFDYFFGS